LAQVSRRTKITRGFLAVILAVSVVVGAIALKNIFDAKHAVQAVATTPQVGSTGSRPEPYPSNSSVANGSEEPVLTGALPPKNTDEASGSNDAVVEAQPQGMIALIISLITSVTSVLGLLMSKYTEWQRTRLEQMKLAVELQQKELELQEMRRKLQNA
jgi:hypothetical protein